MTHSEVLLREALDRNLTLIHGGTADNLASKTDITAALRYYGAEHYVRARERGHVLYVEGGSDLAVLQALAARLNHPAAAAWDERANVYYVRDNYPEPDQAYDLERVEEGFGLSSNEHFFSLRRILPGLKGLAIRDRDRSARQDSRQGGLATSHWRRYEIENYIVSPEALRAYTAHAYRDLPLFDRFSRETDEVLDELVLARVFDGSERTFQTWKASDPELARLVWESRTSALKLSDFAEEFFRRLADRLDHEMLLRKRDLSDLAAFIEPDAIDDEVSEKLDLLVELFERVDAGG